MRGTASAFGPVTVVWPRFLGAMVAVGAAAALLTGIPTDLVPNDWFTRMTAVQGYGYPVWIATSVLSGILAASHWGVTGRTCPTPRAGAVGAAGAGLSWLAVGCPVCSKVIVAAIGAGGAMTYFVQPWLAALSIGLLVAAVAWRWRRLIGPEARRRQGRTAPT